jgi:type IV pilus biogenesis protein PilP
MKMQQELDSVNAHVNQRTTTDMEMVKAEIEAQTAQLKKQIEALQKKQEEQQTEVIVERYEDIEGQPVVSHVANRYKLINVIGVGNQLQATIEDMTTGQNKRIAVGKKLDGYTVKSISLNDGIVLEKNGLSESLNVGR